MATTYYKRDSGTNWNDSASWSTVAYNDPTNTGTFPTSGDTALMVAGSSDLTVTGGLISCSVFDCTGYTGTVTMNSALGVTNTLTFSSTTTFAGNSNFNLTGNVTITSGGCTSVISLALNGYTYTLVGDLYLKYLATASSATINATTSEAIVLSGSFDMSAANISGTTKLKIVNTSTITSTSTSTGLTLPLEIDASGKNVTISGTLYFSGSLTLTAGTLTSGTLRINNDTTLTQNGGTFGTTIFSLGSFTYTITTDIVSGGQLILVGSPTFSGAYDLQFASASLGAYTIDLGDSNIVITGSTTLTGTCVVNSAGQTYSTGGLTGNFSVSGTATVRLTAGTWSSTNTTGIVNPLEIAGGTVTISATVYYTGDSITMTSGTLTGTATPVLRLNNNMTLTQVAGTMSTFVPVLGNYTYTLGSDFSMTGAVTLANALAISGAYTLSLGTLSVGAYTITLTNANLNIIGSTTLTGTFVVNGVGRSFSTAGLVMGTFNTSGTATIKLTGGTWSGSNTTGIQNTNIEIAGGTVTVSGTVYVYHATNKNNFVVTSGTLTGGIIYFKSNVDLTQNGGSIASGISSTANIITLLTAFTTSGAFVFAATTGTRYINGGFGLQVGSWTISSTGIIIIAGNITVTGSTTLGAATTINGPGLLVSTFGMTGNFSYGGTANLRFTGGTWANTNITGITTSLEILGSNVTVSGTVYKTGGSFTLTLGSLTGSGITFSGSVTITITSGTITNAITFAGTPTITLTTTLTTLGVITIAGNCTMVGNFAVTGGSMSTGAFLLTLASNWTITGIHTLTSASANFTGAYTITSLTLFLGISYTPQAHTQLVYTNLATGATNTLTLTSNIAIAGDITIGGTTTMSGNYTVSCVNLILGAATLTRVSVWTVTGNISNTGSCVIAGAYDLACVGLTLAPTFNFTFPSTRTLTVTGFITMNNTNVLASTPSSSFLLNYTGTLSNQMVAFTNFTDVNASGGRTIWDFGNPTLLRTVNINSSFTSANIGTGGFCYL